MSLLHPTHPVPDVLFPLRQWLDSLEIHDRRFARFICRVIPCACPFERDVVVLGHLLFHIPALCKLNPFYDEFIGLRFRALSFLSDICHEDITPYICE